MLAYEDLIKATLDETVSALFFIFHILIEQLGAVCCPFDHKDDFGWAYSLICCCPLSAFGRTTAECCRTAPNSPAEM